MFVNICSLQEVPGDYSLDEWYRDSPVELGERRQDFNLGSETNFENQSMQSSVSETAKKNHSSLSILNVGSPNQVGLPSPDPGIRITET